MKPHSTLIVAMLILGGKGIRPGERVQRSYTANGAIFARLATYAASIRLGKGGNER